MESIADRRGGLLRYQKQTEGHGCKPVDICYKQTGESQMMKQNRRERVRFRPKDVTFVAVRPEFDKLGKLTDISIGGLSFQYMVGRKEPGDEKSFDIDIFMSEDGFYLPGVACKLIYEIDITEEMGTFKDLEFRRCGLQFRELTGEQIYQLDLYIKDQTSGEV